MVLASEVVSVLAALYPEWPSSLLPIIARYCIVPPLTHPLFILTRTGMRRDIQHSLLNREDTHCCSVGCN
jgi:hypothetical protein